MDASNKKTAPVAPLLSSSSSSSSSSNGSVGDINSLEEQLERSYSTYKVESEQPALKKPKKEVEELGFVSPPGFLSPLPPRYVAPLSAVRPLSAPEPEPEPRVRSTPITSRAHRQFSKAGDYYEEDNHKDSSSFCGGMDHLRVHPKFLHSNATSHKWALGAFAELLDNALDEACNGATYVLIDMLKNRNDGSKMLLIQDNGGGMTPDKMRQCMSLGYSSKSKMANTIGHYGNGFKTSTMRLGADVIVFSSCQGNDGRFTRSIGILSYTFLRSTKQEDIVVPMIDYEKRGRNWEKIIRSSADDWNRNLKTIEKWSPYSSEHDLLQQFNCMEDQGTRIIIYNLWEDDEGNVELDFDTDPYDIQIRGDNRDEKKIRMAKQYHNSNHFLTYGHSLRSYSAILYLKLPTEFRIILREKVVKHHSIENDMMTIEETTYKPKDPHISENGVPQDAVAAIKLGFVKDAHHHIDIQGFNVYHKNRLIKPFWRVWNAAGSGGRGIIGVLEANFVKPAHDKQGFEQSEALKRLAVRLAMIQKKYWHTHSHEIGYASQKHTAHPVQRPDFRDKSSHESSKMNSSKNFDNRSQHPDIANGDKSSRKAVCIEENREHDIRADHIVACSNSKAVVTKENGSTSASHNADAISSKLEERISQLQKRLMEREGSEAICLSDELDRERKRSKLLENQLEEANKKLEQAFEEQECVIGMLAREMTERQEREERLQKTIQESSDTIEKLLEKIEQLESQVPICKAEKC